MNKEKIESLIIPTHVRKEWMKMLCEALVVKKSTNSQYCCKYPLLVSRIIDFEIMKSLQSKHEIQEGVFTKRYANIDVFDLEEKKNHAFNALRLYCRKMQRVLSILTFTRHFDFVKEDGFYPALLLEASDEDLSKDTVHEQWLNEFFQKQKMAKDILEGRGLQIDGAKGIFACPKCKSFNVDIDQKQTRSADEPMTNFCLCKDCGKRFVRN
jgi:DNA-directed RNA polymerase subunit M/transcription elongation factor TFIIS